MLTTKQLMYNLCTKEYKLVLIIYLHATVTYFEYINASRITTLAWGRIEYPYSHCKCGSRLKTTTHKVVKPLEESIANNSYPQVTQPSMVASLLAQDQSQVLLDLFNI